MKKLLSKIFNRFRTEAPEEEPDTEEEYESVEMYLKPREVAKVCQAFDAVQVTKKEFISQKEFAYVPEDIQEKVKVAIFTGNVLEEKFPTNAQKLRDFAGVERNE